MERLVYITNGKTFTGEQKQYDLINCSEKYGYKTYGYMPPKVEWHGLFAHVVDDNLTQVTREEAEVILKRLCEEKDIEIFGVD